jgi:signal transduction histidine kinase
VTVRAPAPDQLDSNLLPSTEKEGSVQARLEPLSVLLLDDDPAERIALRRILRRYPGDLSLREVLSVGELRAALPDGRFDCLLLEEGALERDRTDLLRELISARDRRVAVIVLTAPGSGADGLRAMCEGADDYLVKDRLDDDVVLRSIRYATERRRSEILRDQLWRLDRVSSVGRLATDFVHEINNPLATIIGNLSSLGPQPTDLVRSLGLKVADAVKLDQLCVMLDECLAASEHVAGLVRDLRTLSHPDDRPLGLVSLQKTIESAANLSAHQLRGRARLIRDYGDAPAVRGSSQRLMQVFVNLLSNAAQAIPPGHEKQNEVRVATYTDAAGRAVAEVTDTGPGIAPGDRLHLFEPFFTTKPVGEGTGLGLSISRGIIRALGGELELDPAKDAGATFRVILPAAARAPARTDHAPPR